MNKPQCIYNVDEQRCRLCLHKQPLVLTQKGGKHINLVAAKHGENVTILSCGNAVGSAIPPMILVTSISGSNPERAHGDKFLWL
jgi:hypothetical protein